MMSEEEFYAILDGLPKNLDGSVDEKSLIDAVAEKIVVDETSLRIKEATATARYFRRDGKTQADGAIVIPGLEAFAYEKRRLVKDNDSSVIELQEALPKYLFAESRRKRKNATAASRKAERAQSLAEMFGEWAQDQEAGRRRFSIFIEDKSLHLDIEVEQDEDDEDDVA